MEIVILAIAFGLICMVAWNAAAIKEVKDDVEFNDDTYKNRFYNITQTVNRLRSEIIKLEKKLEERTNEPIEAYTNANQLSGKEMQEAEDDGVVITVNNERLYVKRDRAEERGYIKDE